MLNLILNVGSFQKQLHKNVNTSFFLDEWLYSFLKAFTLTHKMKKCFSIPVLKTTFHFNPGSGPYRACL